MATSCNNDQCLPVPVSSIVTDNGAKYNGDISLQEFDSVLPSPKSSLTDYSANYDESPSQSTLSDRSHIVAAALSLIKRPTPRSRSASEPITVIQASRASENLGMGMRTSTFSHQPSGQFSAAEGPLVRRRAPTSVPLNCIPLPVTFEEDKEDIEAVDERQDFKTPQPTRFTKFLNSTGAASDGFHTPNDSPESVSSLCKSIEHSSMSPCTSSRQSLADLRLYETTTFSHPRAPLSFLSSLNGRAPLSPISSPFSDVRWHDHRRSSNTFRLPNTEVEQRAFGHRHAAAQSEPKFAWSGNLPVKNHRNPVFSPKVFLGGMPYEITESQIIEAFKKYGSVTVQFPPKQGSANKAGFVYVIFEHDRNVKALLNECRQDTDGKYYFKIFSAQIRRQKDVQVIPWVIADSNYIKTPSQRLDHTKTVFVGALHGMLTAEGLANIMNDLFHNVAYVGIDTDKFKYPMGSARVTFTNMKSYTRAVGAAFVDVKSARFSKKIQIDPYIDSGPCCACRIQHGPVFCREQDCMSYYCYTCWEWNHSTAETKNHRPLMRSRRNDATD